MYLCSHGTLNTHIHDIALFVYESAGSTHIIPFIRQMRAEKAEEGANSPLKTAALQLTFLIFIAVDPETNTGNWRANYRRKTLCSVSGKGLGVSYR